MVRVPLLPAGRSPLKVRDRRAFRTLAQLPGPTIRTQQGAEENISGLPALEWVAVPVERYRPDRPTDEGSRGSLGLNGLTPCSRIGSPVQQGCYTNSSATHAKAGRPTFSKGSIDSRCGSLAALGTTNRWPEPLRGHCPCSI